MPRVCLSGHAAWVFAIAGAVLAGCAEAPHPEAMAVSSGESHTAIDHTLALDEVSGGQTTNSSDNVTLGNTEFQQALLASLNTSGLFHRVVVGEPGDWRLHATIVSQELRGGWPITEELTVRYELTDAAGRTPLWADTVYSKKDTGMDEDIVLLVRARLLIEATARDNIATFLEHLQRWLAQTRPG